MKTLLVMRHGKSSWEDPALEDFERPLKKRGKRAAEAIGREIKRRGLRPDAVIASAAVRASETAEITVRAAGGGIPITRMESLYGAGAGTYLTAITEAEDACAVVLVVGHNPDLEDLVERLTGEPVEMPTGALAEVEIDSDRWSGLEAAAKRLVSVTLPRDLE